MYIVSIQRTEKKHCIAASDEEWKNGFIDWVDKMELLLNGKKQWKTDILSANPDSAPSNTLLFFFRFSSKFPSCWRGRTIRHQDNIVSCVWRSDSWQWWWTKFSCGSLLKKGKGIQWETCDNIVAVLMVKLRT